jgi:hypothetical protein
VQKITNRFFVSGPVNYSYDLPAISSLEVDFTLLPLLVGCKLLPQIRVTEFFSQYRWQNEQSLVYVLP